MRNHSNALTYAALGASETFGVGAEPVTEGYAYQVARSLRANRFVNAGISGAVLTEAGETETHMARVAHPHLCSLVFGVNDIRGALPLEAFVRALRHTMRELRDVGAKLLVVGIPNLSLLPAAAGIPDLMATVDEWNNCIRTVTCESHGTFLDLRQYDGEIAGHPEYISDDGLHPSPLGHERFAQLILGTIRRHGLWPEM